MSASSHEVGAPAGKSQLAAKDPIGLTDTHCHLNLAAFDRDLEQVLSRALEGGVVRMMVPGVDLASSERAVELADRVEEVFAAVGFHPHSASEFDSSGLIRLRELARRKKVAALGEIGLDFSRERSNAGAQRRSFQEQLGLAADLDLPIIVHVREAVEETLSILGGWAEFRHADVIRGVFHAYGGSEDVAEFAEQWGMFVGIGGIFTYPRADALREKIRNGWPRGASALQKVLLETDSPYLPPQGHRGERNEPAWVAGVASQIAKEVGFSAAQIAGITRSNAQRLFNWE